MDLIKLKCENCGATTEVDSAADKIICQYCKSEILIDDEATKIKRVEEAKLKARQENHEQELKERQDLHEQEVRQQQEIEKQKEAKKFKKGPFGIIVIICAVLDALLCMSSFADGKILAGLCAALMTGLLIWGYLMKAHIIEEPKKGVSIIVIIAGFVLIVPFAGLWNMSTTSYDMFLQKEQAQQLDLSNVVLKEELPMPDKLYGVLKDDRKDLLQIEIDDIQKQDYRDYIKKCTEKGYTIDTSEKDTIYEAYNEGGYYIRVDFDEYSFDYSSMNVSSKSSYSITIRAPEEMSEIEWPTNGLGTKIPQTKSKYGKISTDSSDKFVIHVGKTTKSDYNDYVKECENNGYTINHNKSEKSYKANNGEGYQLSLSYLGGNRIEISIKKPEETAKPAEESKKEETKPVEEPKKEETKPAETTSSSSNGIRSDFKEAMDSYEQFMDEYCSFMKKYTKSNGTDMSLLADYSKYMSKYSDMATKFENWKSKTNEAELKYYLQVQTRVNQKLLEVTK